MISGATRLVGLVGFPIDHSLSPAFQNYLLARAGLDWRYVPFPVARAASLGAAFRGLAAAGVRGWNVTVPHKVAALSLCDEVTDEAREVGAVNTVEVLRDGRLRGHNTDVLGFLAPLRARRVRLDGIHALVLGAGGAARAVAYALARSGAAVAISARDDAKAVTLAAEVETATEGHLHPVPWEDRAGTAMRAALVVNATPLGQRGRPAGEEPSPLHEMQPYEEGALVYDLVYHPLETPLLGGAREQGTSTQDGLDMLVHQGIAALEVWTGAVSLEGLAGDARRICLETLARRSAEGTKS